MDIPKILLQNQELLEMNKTLVAGFQACLKALHDDSGRKKILNTDDLQGMVHKNCHTSNLIIISMTTILNVKFKLPIVQSDYNCTHVLVN